MGSDVSPNQMRGFLVPFAGFNKNNFWNDGSAVTQGTALAGIPEPQQSSSLVLQSRGPQSNGVDIQTYQAGNVGIHNASFIWKYQTDAIYYGWEVPNKITLIDQMSSGLPAGNTRYESRDAKVTPSGITLCVAEYTDTIPTNNTIRIYRIDLLGNLTTVDIDTVTVSSLDSQKRFPCLCIMPDESVVCFAWEVDASADKAYIKSWRSTDDGVTWTEQSSNVLPYGDFVDISGTPGAGASGYDLGRIVAASDANSVLMIPEVISHNVSALRNQYIQYLSSSQGTKFVKIEESSSSPTFFFKDPDIVVFNGVFIISYGASVDNIRVITLTNPSFPISDYLTLVTPVSLTMTTAYNTTSNEITGGGKTMFIDDSGRIHLYVLERDYEFMCYTYSDVTGIGAEDYGQSWNYMNGSVNLTGSVCLECTTGASGANVSETFKNIRGVAGQGDNVLFCNESDNGASNNYEWALQRVLFGGWRTVQYPQLVDVAATDTDSGYNTEEWIPTALPTANTMWTKNSAATHTETITGDALDLTTDATGYVYYSAGIQDKTAGCLCHFSVKDIDPGTTTWSSGVEIRIQQQSGTLTYWVKLVILETSLYLYDLHAATTLDSVTGLALDNDFVFMFWLDNSTGNTRVFYANSGSPVEWQELQGTASTGVTSAGHIHWGILNAAASGTQASSWRFFSIAQGAGAGVGLSQRSPKNGRRYAPNGYWTDIKDGLQLSTLDGPAREGEEWQLRTQYISGVTNVLYDVAPSTSNGWKSDAVANPDTTDVSQERLAFYLDADIQDNYNSTTSSTAIGVHLRGINFRSFTIDSYNASTTTWTTEATVDNSIEGGFTFQRVGMGIFANEADGKFLHYNECKGWYIQLDDGAGNVVVRKIKYSSEGVMQATGTKIWRCYIEDAQGTDPTSGTAHLIPSSCTVIIQENSLAALRITITAQRTKEGYFQIGNMVMGECVFPGQQYSRGRTIQFQADVVSEEQENGTLTTSQTGQGGRNVRIAWTEGVETSPLWDDPADPDYWQLQTTGQPTAAVGSAPTTMLGLVQYLSGGVTPLVYLPAIDSGSGTNITLNRYYEHMMCTMSNDVEIQNVLGDELQGQASTGWGEIFRVGTVTLREVR